jgi:subtilisin family serine protease
MPNASNPDDNTRRFPLRAPRFPYPLKILQLELREHIVDAMPSHDEAVAMFALNAPPPNRQATWQIQLLGLLTLLKSLGAISFDSAFAHPPNGLDQVLTAAEKATRARYYHVGFGDGADLNQITIAVRSNGAVSRVAPLPAFSPPSLPDDPLVGTTDRDPQKQWYLFRCRAPRAWTLATGYNVVIADVDWGCRVTHQDLTNIEPCNAYNSYNGSQNVSSGAHVSHGTSVLGIAGAARNHLGIVGFAPNAKLWPIQATSSAMPKDRLPGSSWARGIDFVLASPDRRRKVVTIENQTSRGRNIEQEYALNVAIQQAIAHGLVVAVAAGNGAADVSIDDHNQKIPETGSILVGATDFHPCYNIRSCFSNFGNRLAVSAPGDMKHDVTCNSMDDASYRVTFGGTSGATPKVAGVCALMLELDSSLTHWDVKAILELSGSEVVNSPEQPAGVFLDAYAALQFVMYGSMRARSTVAMNPR